MTAPVPQLSKPTGRWKAFNGAVVADRRPLVQAAAD